MEEDRATDLSLLLKIERVDLLQLSLKPEEEGRLVCLERGLGVLKRLAIAAGAYCSKDWCCAQFLDELRNFSFCSCTILVSPRRQTFFKAL